MRATASAVAAALLVATPTVAAVADTLTPDVAPSSGAPTTSPTPPVWTPPVEPSATWISQHSGGSSYSRTVTIRGTNLTALAAVQVDGVTQSELVVQSPTQATFTLGPTDFQAGREAISLVSNTDWSTIPTSLTFTSLVRTGRDREMAYAFQHWNDRSSKRFGAIPGNDCANFVSQLLLARGWKQTAAWYDHGQNRWSAPWVSSTAMSRWLASQPRWAQHLNLSQIDTVRVGDIVQFNWTGTGSWWDHTAVVSKVVTLPNGHHDVYYVAHTNYQQFGGSVLLLKSLKAYKHMKVQFWHLKH